jgi:hypothetical protein
VRGKPCGFQSVFCAIGGRILPYREVVNQPALAGELRVDEYRDEALHRFVQVATLHDAASTFSEHAPRLYDVRLVAMSPLAFTLAGLERIDGAEYAQSWQHRQLRCYGMNGRLAFVECSH